MATSSGAADIPASANELGDETFMSADQLRDYMARTMISKASKDVDVMERARLAREELVKSLSQPIPVTPQKLHEISVSLLSKLRAAAARGDTELMVMRFPSALCTDKGRAINNFDSNWPESLVGRPRQAYELWRDRLQPSGYRLKAMIVDWPGGMPGDVGLFLEWGEKRR